MNLNKYRLKIIKIPFILSFPLMLLIFSCNSNNSNDNKEDNNTKDEEKIYLKDIVDEFKDIKEEDIEEVLTYTKKSSEYTGDPRGLDKYCSSTEYTDIHSIYLWIQNTTVKVKEDEEEIKAGSPARYTLKIYLSNSEQVSITTYETSLTYNNIEYIISEKFDLMADIKYYKFPQYSTSSYYYNEKSADEFLQSIEFKKIDSVSNETMNEEIESIYYYGSIYFLNEKEFKFNVDNEDNYFEITNDYSFSLLNQ